MAINYCCEMHISSQSWWKRIKNLGLLPDYKDPYSEIEKWLNFWFLITTRM
jgi:hypothetical protein